MKETTLIYIISIAFLLGLILGCLFKRGGVNWVLGTFVAPVISNLLVCYIIILLIPNGADDIHFLMVLFVFWGTVPTIVGCSISYLLFKNKKKIELSSEIE